MLSNSLFKVASNCVSAQCALDASDNMKTFILCSRSNVCTEKWILLNVLRAVSANLVNSMKVSQRCKTVQLSSSGFSPESFLRTVLVTLVVQPKRH